MAAAEKVAVVPALFARPIGELVITGALSNTTSKAGELVTLPPALVITTE